MKGPIEDVYEFQTKILGNQFPDHPKIMYGTRLYEVIECLNEEIKELEEAPYLPDQADALVDLIYFAYGALHQMGVDTERVWKEVHRANMDKVKGETKRGHENDAKKPEGWKAPDHSWLMRR